MKTRANQMKIKHKCSNIHGFIDIGNNRFNGYYWLLQKSNEDKIPLY